MTQTCRQCANQFKIKDEDLHFYDKISPVFADKKYPIPPPTLCRDCRLQRRTAWRNERYYYPRTCDQCKKSIISIFAPDQKMPVYCNKCWWGDSWDAKTYGRDYDFNRPFFEQLKELMNTVPQLAIQNDDGIGSVNCQYCQDFSMGKNCYFVIGTWYTQDSFYCNINCSYNRDICDCTNISKSELAYECTDSQLLYNCDFLQNSENCTDCFLGFDLKGCRNCFGCIGLRQKQFYIFNKPYSEAEYRQKIASFQLDSYQSFEKVKNEYAHWMLQFPHRDMYLQNCENCAGNNLHNCRNCYGFSMLNGENSRYCDQGDNNMFSYDITNSGKPNWCYEGMTPDNSYMTHFSWFSWKDKYTLYSLNCHSSEHLFGCIALHRAKYCILNKQYTKEEYEKLVPKIIEHMGGRAHGASAQANEIGSRGPQSSEAELKEKSWGEFLPIKDSYFAYNETVAQENFPLTKEQTEAKGWKWREKDPKQYQAQTYQIPDELKDVTEQIIKEILACNECGKNYKIIAQELEYYKKMQLPIPRKCLDCRHKSRLARRTPYKLWQRTCAKCSKPIQTSYSPERPEIVYCEACYLKEVY